MLASEHGQAVDNLIIYVHWLMIVLFVGWLAYFAYALFRFHRTRNPKADYLGVRTTPPITSKSRVAIVEAVLLIGFVAVPLWAKAGGQDSRSRDESTVIQIVAQQFDWNVRYPGQGRRIRQTGHALGTSAPMSSASIRTIPNGKDDVQDLDTKSTSW